MVRTFLLLAALTLAGCALPTNPLLPDGAPRGISAQVPFLMLPGAYCSGVALGPTTVATAAHCVDGNTGTAVLEGSEYPLQLEYVNPDSDLATYKVLEGELPSVAPVCHAPKVFGTRGWIVGYGCSLQRGPKPQLEVRALRFMVHNVWHDPEADYWTGVACHGDSGGGVFDADGCLVGITSQLATRGGEPVAVVTAPADLLPGL